MKKIGNWFGSGPPAQFGSDVRGMTLSVTLALMLVGLAMTNRWLGFAHAHEFVRACERGGGIPRATLVHRSCVCR